MADEKNQNDQVKDLLARLRSQMSQLDEMFGIGDATTQTEEENAAPAVPEEASAEEDFDVEEKAVEEDIPLPEDPEESGEEEPTLVEEEAPETEEEPTEEAPVDDAPAFEPTVDMPVQMDLFEEIDVPAEAEESENGKDTFEAEKASEEHTEAPSHADFADDSEDDAPVFSKEEAHVHIRKESIVAEPVAQEVSFDASEEMDAVVVTEVEDPCEAPREKTDSHASCFVPSTAPGEEDAVSGTALSPFSPDRRFDPSKYDAMLAAYEKRKSEAFEEVLSPEPTEPPKAPVLPTTPVLMPRTTTFVFPEIPEEEDEEEPSAEEDFSEEASFEVAPDDEYTEDAVDTQVYESVEEKSAFEPVVVDTPEEIPAPPVKEPAAEIPQKSAARSRIVRAEGALGETERDARSRVTTGRIHLAPSAYRTGDERAVGKSRYVDESDEDEEDFMDGLPSGIRDSLIGFPLGRPNRAQGWNLDTGDAQKPKKKRKSYRFPEEIEGVRDEDNSAPSYVRHHLKEALMQTRARLLVISALAFVLLLLENISLVQGFVPPGFVDVQTAGVIDALLLLGIVIAAWPRLQIGLKGIFHGRILPESVLLLQALLAFGYAVVLGVLGEPAMYLSFVPALGLSILYRFRVLRCETDLRTFEKVYTVGDKLVLSPALKKEIVTEGGMANGKSSAGDSRVYRMQKAAAVKGFSARSGRVCEDEWLNLVILLSCVFVGAVCFLIAYFAKSLALTAAIRAALFGCFLSSPLAMLGVHIYSMHRTDCAAGADSAIVGETSVREAIEVQAVAFEDIEAAPSSGVVLSGIRVHCDDPTAVFKYLTALYGHIGGPLCGRFSGMYGDKSIKPKASVELVKATRDGVSAVIDGAEIVVGNGRYMTDGGISPSYDPEDERVLSDGKSGILYIAVNGMVCMKFYMEHRISSAFEKSVLHLYRLGIGAILRTYDPNFNEKTVARSAALRECRTQVVGKTVEQRNDFYAEQADGGIVTAKNSTKLLRLLLLCFRTHRLLRFGKAYKLVTAVFGGAVAVALCALGVFTFLPSVYLALYHLVLLALYMLVALIGIRLPEISEGK